MDKQVIEFAGQPVGIVIPEDGMLKFIAVKFHVHDLDNHKFHSPTEVVRAIAKMLQGKRSQEQPQMMALAS